MEKFIERINRAVSKNYVPDDPMTLPRAEHALQHEFDILGSGWIRCFYGMIAPGYEGNNYSDPAFSYQDMRAEASTACPEQAERMSECAQLLRCFVPDYQPVFWYVCLRSGYRQKAVWESEVPIATVEGVDVKLPSDLSRCHDLLTLAKAWKITHDARYRNEVIARILDWLSVNPYYYGPCWRNGMNASIRTLNWICSISMIDLDLNDEKERRFAELFREAMDAHRRFIAMTLECYRSHNHMTAELGGILVSGSLFSEPKYADAQAYEAEAWRRIAARDLNRELGLQILDDGFDFEGSTSYHAYVLEMFLYPALIYARLRGYTTPSEMLGFLSGNRELGENIYRLCNAAKVVRTLSQPDGYIPYISDNDAGRYLEFERCDTRKRDMRFLCCVASVLFDDASLLPDTVTEDDFVSCGAFFDTWTHKAPSVVPASTAFPNCGYYVLTDGKAHCVVRCGGISGHSHNDQLSYTLAVGNGEFVVDPGTYTYTGCLSLRKEIKSAKNHNCIIVDGEETNRDCCEKAFGFAYDECGAKCLQFINKNKASVFCGEQYAYRRLPDELTQNRKIQLEDNRLIIQDRFDRLHEAPKSGDISSYIVLHPECEVSVEGRTATIKRTGTEVTLCVDGELTVEECIYSHSYGLREQTNKLRIRYPRDAEKATAVFEWREAEK